MFAAEIITHVGRFCEVATRSGVLYGDLVRLSSVLFLIRPRPAASVPPCAVYADEIVGITPLPDPR